MQNNILSQAEDIANQLADDTNEMVDTTADPKPSEYFSPIRLSPTSCVKLEI